MQLKTKGIVFKAIKHKETSLILHIYTLEKGLRSFIINGVRKPKAKMGASLFQPGTLLDLEVYFHENKDINRIKEAKPAHIYQTIPFEMARGGLMLLMLEVMNKCIWESEKNDSLFEYLWTTLKDVDNKSLNVGPMALEFMMTLSQHLGFFPYINTLPEGFDYDMIEMMPIRVGSQRDNCFTYDMCQAIIQFKSKYNWAQSMTKEMRTRFLEKWFIYYKIHVHNFQTPKSYEILKEVFNA